MDLRKHQAEFVEICKEIVAGAPVRDIFCLVAPGGGKSSLPLIAAKYFIDADLADAICWVVPRSSLQRQAEENFMNRTWREALSHENTIRASTNDNDPCRGYQGFVTTYQALGIDYHRTAAADFDLKRYILFLDEFHHCETDKKWYAAVDELVGKAHFRIMVTGTLERGNGKTIGWVPYRTSIKNNEMEEQTPDLSRSDDKKAVIRYSRSDALAEKAILPIHFFLTDAKVKFMDAAGAEKEYNTLRGVRKIHRSAALGTAISTKYAEELLDMAIGHWKKHRLDNPTAKLLVVTANIKNASNAVSYLKSRWKEYNIAIATSHDGNSDRSIRSFRHGDVSVLVTISIAYEGLDVPEISHIACLTNIRSTPWIEQMLARAVRINRRPEAGPYEKQIAYVFAPKDDLFINVVKKIESEQAPIIRKMLGPEQMGLFWDNFCGNNNQGNGENTGAIPSFIPLKSRLTQLTAAYSGPAPAIPIPETPSEKEGIIRDEINRYVLQYAVSNFYAPKKINAEIAAACGKKRNEMTMKELEYCLDYVKRSYPLTREATQTPLSSPPRKTKRRFPTGPQPWP